MEGAAGVAGAAAFAGAPLPVAVVVAVSGRSGREASSSFTRTQLARPRCQMPMIQPSATVGQESKTR